MKNLYQFRVWVLFCVLIAGQAFAGYQVDTNITTSGTDSSGASSSILRLEVISVSNASNYVTFKISKKDGSAFSTSGIISMRLACGDGGCATMASTSMSSGSFSKTFNVYMPLHITGPVGEDVYGRYEAAGGYWSYVGPIRVSAPALATPGSTSTSEITTASARLNWGAVTAAESYRYQVTDGPSFDTNADGSVCNNCVTQGTTTQTDRLVSGLAPGTGYRWRVRAGNVTTGQGSPWSSPRLFTTVAPVVNGVTPLIAQLGSETIFTISGSNLPSGMGFWVDQCVGMTEIPGGNATSRQFRGTPSFSPGLKAGEVKNAPGGTSLFTFQVDVRSAATVTSVSPTTATLGESTLFTVFGNQLTSGMGFWIDQCEDITQLAGGSTTMQQFRCTPSFSAGLKNGEVKTAPGGTLLKSFTVEVVNPSTAAVTAITPSRAVLNEPTVFTIEGTNLTAGMGFWIHDCVGVTELAGGTATRRQFRCTPRNSTGLKPGVVKTAPGGTVLRNFEVEVIAASNVTSVSPLAASLDQTTIFTVKGHNLPQGMGFWIDQCTGITELPGGSSVSRRFQCTPSFATGLKSGEVKVSPGGSLLHTFLVNVTAQPQVTSVSPLNAELGVATVFTVQGSGLLAGMNFWLEGGTGLQELSGGNSSSRQFQLTPSLTAGQKAGEIRLSAGGPLLHSFSVAVSSATPHYLNVDPWALAAAGFLVTAGILVDPPNHDLRGTDDINRAELATLIYRALGGGLQNADANFASWHGRLLIPPFADVRDGDVWYYRAASYLGNLAGSDAVTVFDRTHGAFRPAGSISRAWSLKALLQAWDIEPLAVPVPVINDVPASHPAAGYVYKALELGLITNEGDFRPDDVADRQELFVILHRLLDASANLLSQTIAMPVPLHPEDFDDNGAYLARNLGSRYAQPVLTGVETPTVSISAGPLLSENSDGLEGFTTMELEAVISNLDPNTYVDAGGASHTATPFCAWSAEMGSLLDISTGSVAFSRVKWIAPVDFSPQNGSGRDVRITLYCGDGLGSEVKATHTIQFDHNPSPDSTLPVISMDTLPSDLIGGQVITIRGTAMDNGNAALANFGALQIQLAYSSDGGATWLPIGLASQRQGGVWDREWQLPDSFGPMLVRARVTNGRGNDRETQTSFNLQANLALSGVVIDLNADPVPGAVVTLSSQGLEQASQRTDSFGAFHFSNLNGAPLQPTSSYTLTAKAGSALATAQNLVLSEVQPLIREKLVIGIDSTPPETLASVSSDTYSAPFTVALTCSDDDSGCATTYYTTDGSYPDLSSPIYSAPIPVSEDTTLRYFSVDALGNREQTLNQTYYFESCSFEVIAFDMSFPQTGGNGSAAIVTLGDCTWTATSNSPWLVLTSPASQTGNGALEFYLEPNTSGQARMGTINVMGEQLQIGQSASDVYLLAINKAGNGSGKVISNSIGIDCGSQCTAEFSSNEAITLTPVADPGSYFAGWSGGGCFGTLPCNLSLSENGTVTAIFNTGQGSNVLSSNPANGDTGVATNSNIRINFSNEIQQGPGYNDIEIRETGGDPVAVSKYLYSGNGLLYLDPSGWLEENTNYTVTIPANAIGDSTGNPLNGDYILSFTTRQPGSSQIFMSAHPTLVMEGDSTQVTIWYDQVVPRDRYINLQASTGNQLDFPSQVVVPAGEIGIEFEVEATRNYVADMNRTVTLSGQALGGQQASLDILIKDDDPILGNALRIAATGIIHEDNGNGIFEADEVADFLVEVYNSSGTFQVNTTVEVDIVNTYNMRTLGSGTCTIGGIGSGRIEGCDVSLLADGDLPTGEYWLKITLTSNTDTTVDYARVNVVNNSLPDFQISSPSASTYTLEPGHVFDKRFIGVHRGDGFSAQMPMLNVYIEEDGNREILFQTYMEIRGDLYDEWLINYDITTPSVPGTYRIWGEINPSGPNQLAESIYDNNQTSVLTLIVRDDNKAPILDFIGDKAINAGELLTFAASAIDPNPEDTIGYSLNNAPTGAIIDPVTGLFNWSPDENQGQGDYKLAIVATDDRNPALSDSEAITIRVDKRADLAVRIIDNLSEAVPGQTLSYTLEVSNDGPNAVMGASVANVFPAQLTGTSWSCIASDGSACGSGGVGNLADNPDILAGGVLTYTLTGRVINSANGSLVNTCTVSAPTGVVDQIAANNTATDVNSLRQLDFGDAPNLTQNPAWNFPTLLGDNGARHGIVDVFFLGASVDPETEGQPDANASGDAADEDGVVFPQPLVACETAQIEVTLSASGMVDAWIDFNGDGDWDDLGEQILVSEFMTTGMNTIALSVPCDAMPASTAFARFRLSSDGNLSYDGLALDGEVEDYAVPVLGVDFGDAPDPMFPTLKTSDGARHVLSPALYLGQVVDAEHNGQPDASAAGDNQNGANDEDGVVFDPEMRPGMNASLSITASGPGFVDAWIDFNGDGDWADNEEQILSSVPVTTGVNALNFSIPVAAIEDFWTYARFRISSMGGLAIDGLAPDGEVEDYQIRILERCAAPQVVTSPEGVSKCEGESVSFAVSTTGTGPLNYQWRLNGMDINGANAATYTIDVVVAGDAGVYDCRILNACGTVTSDGATLDVREAVAISLQPASLAKCSGDSVSFSVVASGNGSLTYQWHKNGADIPGADTSTLTLNEIASDDAGNYSCTVSNSCNAITSQLAELTVQVVPSITQQPMSIEVCPGDAAMFSVVATGAVGYQWRNGGINLPGAVGASLSLGPVGPSDAGNYSCIVTSECGSVTSSTANLAILAPVSILDHPDSQVFCQGDQIELTVSANGDGPIFYQWYKDELPLEGQNTNTLVLSNMAKVDEGEYSCDISGACSVETSNSASLTFDGALRAETNPGSLALGLNPPIFNVDIECAIPMVETIWVAEPPTSMIPNGTTVTLAPPPQVTTTLEVRVSDGSGATIKEQAVLLVSLNSGFEDFNLDGCNNMQDLWDLSQFWNQVYPGDPTDDGFIDVLDLLFINISDPNPCP